MARGEIARDTSTGAGLAASRRGGLSGRGKMGDIPIAARAAAQRQRAS